MPRRTVMAVMLFAVLVGAGLGAYAIVTGQQGGNPPTDTSPAEPTPTPFGWAPNACGDWHDARAAIASQYGEIRECSLFHGTWLMVTLGKFNVDGTRGGGVVALYDCSGDKACLDHQTDHPFGGWTFVSPPLAGEVSITDQLNDQTLVLIVSNDQEAEKYTFNVVTRVFTLLTSPTKLPATSALP